MARVETVNTDGFRGRVHGVSLVDLLQMFHLSRRTIALRLGEGSIHLRDGEVIHAEAGDLAGEDAFQLLIGLTSGELDVEELKAVPITVERSFETILMDALVKMDERNAGIDIDSDALTVRPPDNSGVRANCRTENFDSVCQAFIDGVQDAMCCAVVGLDEEAQVLGIATIEGLEAAVEPSMARAAAALFRSTGVVELEIALAAREPPTRQSAIPTSDEVHLIRGPYLYLGRTIANKDAALLVVTKRSCPIGLAIAQLNSVLLRLGSGTSWNGR